MNLKSIMQASLLVAAMLLVGAAAAFGQAQQVNLTAAPANTTLPDGSVVPMWGYTCAVVSGSTVNCLPLDPSSTTSGSWSPVIITVPAGQDLQINLTNNLLIPTTGSPNAIPTSLVIVGQVGGGLGTPGGSTPSPIHNPQTLTWPASSSSLGDGSNTPPTQGPRVQSFGTEVPAGSSASLCWGPSCPIPSPALKPGTYLIESGTHPSIQVPMGLIGMVVVTTAPAGSAVGCAYPGATAQAACAVPYNAEVPLLFSEIDPVQNNGVATAAGTVGFSETNVWDGLNGAVASITLLNGGSGYSANTQVTITDPAGTGNGASATPIITGGVITGFALVGGNAYSPSTTITITDTTGTGALASVTVGNGCGAAHTCYPPAVNYRPLYYLINGSAFDKTNGSVSQYQPLPAGVNGTLLVRMVNAGLRMHVPSMVGTLSAASTPGMSLIAEDGNALPGTPRVQSEVFMPAGKTYDVMLTLPTTATTFPVFDRELSLSGNARAHDTGMLAYVSVNGGSLPPAAALTAASVVANADAYSVNPGVMLSVLDPTKGLVGNDLNVYGVKLTVAPTHGTLALNADGTFTYTPDTSWSSASANPVDTFTYQANGNGPTAVVSLNLCKLVSGCLEGGSGITVANDSYTSSVATKISIAPPGVLVNDSDGAGYPLTLDKTTVTALSPAGPTLLVDETGGFSITGATPGATYTFTYQAKNTQGTQSASAATVTVMFPVGNGPRITLIDGTSKAALPGSPQDYRWIIEEDRTFYIDPNCQTNPLPATCPTVTPAGTPAIFGTNFHSSYMPVVAEGCTASESCETGQSILGVPAVCDLGNGACRTDASQKVATFPWDVVLDPTKHYYISVMPADMADADPTVPGQTGHDMGGAAILPACTPAPPSRTCTGTFQALNIIVEPELQHPAQVSAFVFEDDHPLNGEHDGGGGIDVLSPNEPGLGGFNITILDLAGQSGDAVGQMTYDQFNQPLSNALAGTIDPVTNQDACPVSVNSRSVTDANGVVTPTDGNRGITGVIPVCPKYEADGKTLSPLAGQALVKNMPPGRYGIVATPGADRIARGEEWLQTNTLDGGKDHEAFIRTNEPAYFQEFGPASYHVSIGFANPQWITDVGTGLCNGPGAPPCTQTITGLVSGARMSRPSDERLYGSGTRDIYSYTQCYASLGSPDGADFAFSKCAADGTFTLKNIPEGDWRITIFDQWNDQIVDGISTPVRAQAATNATLCPGSQTSSTTCDMGELGVHGWKNNLYTRTFFDMNGNGVADPGEDGLALVSTNIRYRDGSYSNFNSTDLDGNAGFNEVFPIFNWYVMETDSTRYKNTGVHVINDAGGPVDGSSVCGTSGFPACGDSSSLANMARTKEDFSLPTELRVPGAVYCDHADCGGFSILTPLTNGGPGGSTGRIDPPVPVATYGWQSYMGQNQLLEFGKKPFAACPPACVTVQGQQIGENGGIHGHVVYASTRPFDDPTLLLQNSWEPLVPHVTINLYQENVGADGTQTLTLADTTTTSSWDDWAQGFRRDASGNVIMDASGGGIPNMSCPGQDPSDLFFYTMKDQPSYLDWYNFQHSTSLTAAVTPLPYHSQYKCYDGMHNWNQLLPAPYDGMYSFPSVTSVDLTTGKPNGTNCKICVSNPAPPTDWSSGLQMLPSGKYVVEVVVPPGYELVKEEDKNLLTGDIFTAPVVNQFAGFGNIFIMPDQASVAASYNPSNPVMSTADQGRTTLPSNEGDTGSVEQFWPCVGEKRIVPDFLSLNPALGFNTPFAGATRPLCDRKEVTLTPERSVLAKFYVFTSAHIAGHITGIISDDFTSEFDPFSPAFGEKFSPPNLPVSIKTFEGNEVGRLYSDQHGIYNGLVYSSWTVNPPDPSGYTPQMFVMCMNDRGSAPQPDKFYQPAYSQFCYEWSIMPGQTGYLDTPVIPTAAFAPNYNHPDCNYPNGTPAIKEVDGDGVGPWVQGTSGHVTFTVTSLGSVDVTNYGYSGPAVTAGPFNQKTVSRSYGFGGTKGTVSVGTYAVPATSITTWNDSTIVFTVPTLTTTGSNVPLCAVQQQQKYGGPAATTSSPNARCGELVITAANGKHSVDALTLTIGGKAPKHVAASESIQTYIDGADPGDLIIVDPTCATGATVEACTKTDTHSTSAHHELLLMWKPVRLQGVGAPSVLIDANAHPSGTLLNDWRLRVNCLFGLAPNGVPTSYDPGCASGFGTSDVWTHFHPTFSNPQVDRLPLEATVGWDATLNGNLAEQLQEPSLMGAYEGAAITVLAKGVYVTEGEDPWTDGTEASAYPADTQLQNNSTNNSVANRHIGCGPNTPTAAERFPSSFWCNPSSIDGLSITNSSQGGGGIFVHGWAHNLEIANNRVYNNQGTLAGGITLGQGEHPGVYQAGGTNSAPGPCQNSPITNTELPYCFDMNLNVHHNAVTMNASEGDELFSATSSGAGGVAFCSGTDNYQFNFNWVCGNLSTGDGAGVSQIGFVYNGSIQHNSILFNQATNPTTPSNGGGLLIMSAPDTDPTCPGEPDADCSHAYGTVGDGIGPGLVVNANLIIGNAAEAGSGGGIRFQGVNGLEVGTFPTTPTRWFSVNVTNNIIANNVAGWDGAGVSLQDSIGVNLINNTIVSNDSTATSGTLFGAFFAPQASAPTPCPTDVVGANLRCTVLSTPQPAGISAAAHSAEFIASLTGSITCPVNHPINLASPGSGVVDGECRSVSYPEIFNNVVWKNRAFSIDVVQPATGSGQLQSTVTLIPQLNQTSTGFCATPTNVNTYWDLGFRSDLGPTDHSSGHRFQPKGSLLSPSVNLGDYPGGPSSQFAANSTVDPTLILIACNGSKIPPEAGPNAWYQVPPGTNESNVPIPVYSMTAGATVDEGNNWVNISWGPLSLINPNSETTPSTETVLSNYGLQGTSPAINFIEQSNSSTTYTAAPSDDFYGTLRKTAASPGVDAGAVEFSGGAVAGARATVTPNAVAFGNWAVGKTSNVLSVTVTNTGTVALAGGTFTLTLVGGSPLPYARVTSGTFPASAPNCGAALAVGNSCTIKVQFAPTANGTFNRTLTVNYTTAGVVVSGSPVQLSGTGVTANATVSILPNPLTITLPVRVNNGTGTLTVTNTAPAGSSQFNVTNIATAPTTGGFTFTVAADTCTGVAVAPGANCTVTVRFTNSPGTARGVNRAGTITITDTATGSPQVSNLIGHAN